MKASSALWRYVKTQLLPHSADPKVAQQEYTLNLILLSLAGPGFLLGLIAAALWALDIVPAAVVGAWVGFGVQPFYLLAHYLARHGRVRLASYVPPAILFLTVLGTSWLSGIGHATLAGWAVMVTSASILLGIRATIVLALSATAACGLLGWLQLGTRLPFPLSPQEAWGANVVALAFGSLIVATSYWLATRQLHAVLQQSLSHLQYQSQELETAYDEKERLAEEVQAKNAEQAQLVNALQRLSASLIPVTDEITVLPIAGDVNAERIEQIATGLLDGVAERRARIVIADLTGVLRFDTDAVKVLLEVAQALRLLGCELFLVGMPLHIAQGLASQEPLLKGATVLGDLQDGISHALARLGKRIVAIEEGQEFAPEASSKAEMGRQR